MLRFSPRLPLRFSVGVLLSVTAGFTPLAGLAHPDHHQPTQQGQNPSARDQGEHQHDHQH